MNWYFRRDGEDLTVPNGSESSGRLYAEDGSQSGRSWFEWDLGRDENITQSSKNFAKTIKGDGKASDLRDVKCSKDQNSFGDLLFSDLPDHPLQNSLERMDFWDSGFVGEMVPHVENPSDSSEVAYTSTSFQNFSSDMLVDQGDYSLNYPSIKGSPGCSEGPYTWDDGMVEEIGHETDFSLFCVTDSSRSLEGSTTPLPKFEESTVHLQEQEASMENNTLHELEGLLSQQMDPKMRICFRDALYRLADTSKHHHASSENKKRKCGQSSVERETNAIDRAIASMMFRNLVSPRPPPF